jgi:hypothetical protein
MITIEPKGGLCNRIRFIDSARVLCERIGRPLTIVWRRGAELECGFDKLFEIPADVSVVEKRYAKEPAWAVMKQVRFIRDFIVCRLHYRHVIFESGLCRLIEEKYDFTKLRCYSSVYMTGCSRFFRPQRKFMPFLVVDDIQQRVDDIVGRFGVRTVGVHIRRTDHAIVIERNPEHAFMDAIQRELRTDPMTTFFLATDSPDVESRFMAAFGDRIIRYPKEFGRNTVKGVQDALVDLVCLSRTGKIIGSEGSSFSETAAQISDIPLEFAHVKHA